MLRDLECTAASVTATATVTVTVTATATVTVTVTVTATVTVTVTVTATVTATATATATATVTATVTVTVTATATVTVTTNNNNITFINNYNDVGQQIFAVVKSASSCTKTPLCLIHFQLFASQNEFRKFNSLCLSVRLFYSYCYREAFRDISY